MQIPTVISSSPHLVQIKWGRPSYSYNDHRTKFLEKISRSAERTIPILALDGGGSRIAYSLELAVKLEEDVGSILGDKTIKIGEIFKGGVMGGTSGGAIEALCWNLRDPLNKEKPLYSAKDLNAQFNKIAPSIFTYSRWRSVKNWIWNTSLYDQTGLKTFAKEFFKGALYKDALNPLVVPTYQLNSGIKTLFLTPEDGNQGPFQNLTMEDLLCMTTAAPTFFDPVEWNGQGFVDGGIFANNPADGALAEAERLYGKECKFVICSFGTGINLTPLDKIEKFDLLAHGWGMYTWAPHFLDLQLNASSEATHEIMESTYGDKSGYYRWQSDIPYIPLDTIDPAALDNLRQKAREERENHIVKWQEMVNSLAQIVKEQKAK